VDKYKLNKGFSLKNKKEYVHPFPKYANFGFAAICNEESNTINYIYTYGKGNETHLISQILILK
jgi:hypothetical protein